jgi:chromatin remodeling complex protein RSC6
MVKSTKSIKSTESKKSTMTDTEDIVQEVVEEEVEEDDTKDTGPDVSEDVTTVDTITDLINRIENINNTLKNEIKTVLSDLKSVRKVVTKLEKKKNKKRVVNPDKPRAPSGITRPTMVSDELRDFLGLAEGELIPRTEVTRRVSAYIVENNMKNPTDGRQIDLDREGGEKLRALLKPNPEISLNFFNLQTYLKPHFLKNTEAAPTTEAAPKTETAPATEAAPVEENSTKVRTARRVRKTRADLEVAN